MTPQTLSVLSDEAGWGRSLVASLPRSLRRVDSSDADISLIDGRGDWVARARARLNPGCHAVLLIDPDFADASAIAELAQDVEQCGACCIVSEQFAGHPGVAGYRDWLTQDFGTITLESVSPNTPKATVFAQLRLLRACGLAVTAFDTVTRNSVTCLIEADVLSGERRVHIRLSATQSSAGKARHRMTAYASASMARLELAQGGEAQPATASLFSAEGVQILPSIHESAHRHHLRALLAGERSDGAEALRALARDMTLATSLRPAA